MLFLKMFRDLRLQKGQFLSVLLMIFIGFFVFAGTSAVGDGMRVSSEDYYSVTNLADAVIYSEGITPLEVQEMEKQKGIKRAERRAQIEVNLTKDKETVLSLNVIEKGEVSSMYYIAGETYKEGHPGVWLDSMFAKSHRLKCGDTVEVVTLQGNMKLTIKGLIMHPEYVYAIKDDSQILPDHESYGYGFISGKMYSQITDAAYSQLLIQGSAKKESLEGYAEKYLSGKNAVVLMQKDFTGQAMFANEIEQQKAMQLIFPAAFLLIALLTMITAMTRITANQRTQIGTLKAVGVSSYKIYVHYLAYAVLPPLTGAVLGAVLGAILLPKLMFKFQSEFYALPNWSSFVSGRVSVAVIACICVCGVAGMLACRKELSQVPSEVLRPKAPKPVKLNMGKQKSRWSTSSFKVQWNLRDIMRNKIRSFITVAGVAGSMMLILCALGLNDTMGGLFTWMYEDLNTYETKVVLKEDNQVYEKMHGAQYIQEGQAQVKIKGKKYTENLTVTGVGPHLKYTDKKRNYTELPEAGIAVTYKTSQLKGIKKGDVIQWKPYGTQDWMKSKVNAIIRTPLVQGIYMTKKNFESGGLTFHPTAFVTDKMVKDIGDDKYKSVQSKESIKGDMDSMMETMNIMIRILILAALLLGMVVLYNLGVLSFAEKVRDLATLQVLGFKDSQLRGLLAIQNVWLSMAGIAVGLPLGKLLLSYLLKFMGDAMDMMPLIYGYTYVVSGGGIFLFSTVMNYMINAKIKKIKMVEALKGAE